METRSSFMNKRVRCSMLTSIKSGLSLKDGISRFFGRIEPFQLFAFYLLTMLTDAEILGLRHPEAIIFK